MKITQPFKNINLRVYYRLGQSLTITRDCVIRRITVERIRFMVDHLIAIIGIDAPMLLLVHKISILLLLLMKQIRIIVIIGITRTISIIIYKTNIHSRAITVAVSAFVVI